LLGSIDTVRDVLIPDKFYYAFRIFKGLSLIAVFSKRYCNLGFVNNSRCQLLSNRSGFLGCLGVNPSDLITCKQVHSANVAVVRRVDRGRGAFEFDSAIDDTDAMVTQERGLPIAVFSADCLPIFLYDVKNKTIGLIHAGWQGTAGGVLINTARVLIEEFGCNPTNLLVAFGPSIGRCCYEVGEDFRRIFSHGLVEREGRLYLDLVAENFFQARSFGIPEKNVSICAKCTSCDNEEFFSFRKEGKNAGRIMSLMMLK